ncbi:MAG TPA: hypothetical protein VHE37_07915, partial [Nevskiaceae bacterium]|nr:hypothetical protein [Nevskiaceae bacterium]
MLAHQLLRGTLVAALCALSFEAAAIPEGPDYPSPAWIEREAANYAKTAEGPAEEAENPAFIARWEEQQLANQQSWNERWLNDPTWLGYPSGNTTQTPLCTVWFAQCSGNPFDYPDTDPFYVNEGEVTPFVIYDDGCARLS